MATRCNSIFLMFLMWCIAAPKLTHQLKSLVKVPSDVRVPGCYFVQVRQSASVAEMQSLVDEIRALDANASMPEFEAKGLFTLTKLSYGFSAKLSNEALQYVSYYVTIIICHASMQDTYPHKLIICHDNTD